MGQWIHMDSPTCLMVHLDMRALRWNSEFAWTVPPVPWYNRIGWTVGYGGSDGTVDSHGQFHCGIPLDFCYIQQIWSSLAYLKLCFIQIEHNRLKLLQHPLVNNFLFQKFWVMAFPLLLISLLFYLVFLVTFSVFTLRVPRPGPDSETCKISETLYSAVYQYLCPLNQLAHFLHFCTVDWEIFYFHWHTQQQNPQNSRRKFPNQWY